MKIASRFILVSFFLLVSLLVSYSVLTAPETSPAVRAAKDAARIRNLRFFTTFWQIACVAASSAGLVTVVLVGVSYSRSVVKRASVHLYKVGRSEIVVHERDLSLAWPVVTGLVNAEKLEKLHGGLEQALALYTTMADVQTRQIRALVGQRGVGVVSAGGFSEVPALPAVSSSVPTFAQLLAQGEIAPGTPVIFGFRKATGLPERGPLQDLYSTILIGLSGFGKTTCLAYLIGASMLAEQARFTVLDLHYPAPESLGSALGELVSHPALTLVSNPFCLPECLTDLEQTLDARLAAGNTRVVPWILVVDEHERWARHVSRLLALELRIINEGRKVKVYLFLTSKSAKADKIGDSALRDNMVTSYVFKTKTHNARTFFKDRDKEALLKQVRQVGEAVFTNRKDDSCVVRLPYATPEDMQTVASMLENPTRQQAQESTHETGQEGDTHPCPSQEGNPEDHPTLTPAWLKQQRQRLGLSLQDVVDRAGVKNKMQLSRFEHGHATLSEAEQTAVFHVLQPHNGSGPTL